MQHDISQINIAVVRSLFEAFGRGDIVGVLSVCSPDIEWQVFGSRDDFPVFGTRTGLPGIEDFFRAVAETHRISLFDLAEVHADGRHVYTTVRFIITVPQTGRTVDSEFLAHFEVENGKIVRLREYLDTSAFAAAWRA